MIYFIDAEFAETGSRRNPTIDLISIALVSGDGREYYAESSDFDQLNGNDWVDNNVMPRIGKVPAKTNETIAKEIVEFIGNDACPEFWGYYCAHDWVVFCWLYGGMIDLPSHFPQHCMDLQQWWVQLGRPNAKPLIPSSEHHAMADARWNRDCWANLDLVERNRRS